MIRITSSVTRRPPLPGSHYTSAPLPPVPILRRGSFLSFLQLLYYYPVQTLYIFIIYCHCHRKRPSTRHLQHASHSTPYGRITRDRIICHTIYIGTHARHHVPISPNMFTPTPRALAVVVRRVRVPRTGGGGGGGGVGRGPPRSDCPAV